MKLWSSRGDLIPAEERKELTECIIWKTIIYDSSEMESYLIKTKNSKQIVLFENQELKEDGEKI